MQKKLNLSHFWLFCAIAIIAVACDTPEKLLYKGNYDGAVELAVRCNSHAKKRDKDILTLEQVFNKAQEHDLARIEYLRREGQASSWDELNRIYTNIKRRQTRVAMVTPLRIVSQNRDAKLNTINVDEQIIESKKNASAYYYAKAQKLIAESETEKDRLKARVAHAELLKIDEYYKEYKDKEALKARALDLGTNRVFFKMVNNSGMVMPADFERELLSIGMQDVNSPWLRFQTTRSNDSRFDYEIFMNVVTVEVTPEQQREREYVDEKTIQSGTENVLDGRGKPKKDSLGNIITRPLFRNVRATVLEVSQRKMARVGGRIEIYNTRSTKPEPVKTIPANADAVFENFAATFRGDREALSTESAQKIGNRPKPFPTTPELLMLAADRLKPIIKQAVADQRGILESGK
jgi:hypothetical protein